MGTRETNSIGRRAESARGAILIHVGLAILVLMGLSAFVLDQGVFYLARVQAQNAADAGALAGATSLAIDNAGDFTDTGPAHLAAYAAASNNIVFGDHATPTVHILNIAAPPACNTPNLTCVQVNVYRDGTNGSATLPVYFAPIFGVTSQAVNATATAQKTNANFTPCMRPWLISDRWIDNAPPAYQFDPTDVYVAPTPSSSGTGWNTLDLGMSLTPLTPGDPTATMDGRSYYEMGDVGVYASAITGCASRLAIGDAVTAGPPVDPNTTAAAVAALTADGPMIVPVALFSPDEYAAADRSSGHFTLHIVSIMGLRIAAADGGGNLYGTVATAFGEIEPGPPPVGGPTGGLLKYIMLVR